MLIAEYSYEKDIQVKQEEALQLGEKKGIILSSKVFQAVKENPDFTDEQIAGKVVCTVENVKDVRKMFSI